MWPSCLCEKKLFAKIHQIRVIRMFKTELVTGLPFFVKNFPNC